MPEKIKSIGKKVLSHRFVKFIISGGIAYLVDFSILTLSTYLLFGGKNFTVLGIISVPQFLAALFGLVTVFIINRQWVFKANGDKLRNQVIRFIIFSIVNVFIASILFTIVYTIYYPFFTSLNLPVAVLLFFTSITKEFIKMFISFFFYKNFVFK